MAARESVFFHKGTANQKRGDAKFLIKAIDTKHSRKWSAEEKEDFKEWLLDCKRKLNEFIDMEIEFANLNPLTK